MDFNENKEWDGVVLSMQAISTLMISLQKCLMDQSDIVPILQDLKWARHMDTNELHVLNPPALKIDLSEEEEE